MNFHPLTRRLHSRTGFTLVELLTVIAIVVILMALTIPIVGVARSSASAAKCKSTLRQLSTAYLLYAQERKGNVLDDNSGWTLKLEPYLARAAPPGAPDPKRKIYDFYLCPSAPERPVDANGNGVIDVNGNPSDYNISPDYGANMHGAVYADYMGTGASPKKLNAIDRPGRVFVFADWIPRFRFAKLSDIAAANSTRKNEVFRHDGKMNAVFVDGHIEQFACPFPADVNAAPWR